MHCLEWDLFYCFNTLYAYTILNEKISQKEATEELFWHKNKSRIVERKLYNY